MTSSTWYKTFFFISIIVFFHLYLCSCSNATCGTSDAGCQQSSNFVSSVRSVIEASSQAIYVITSQLNHIVTNDFDLPNAIHDCVELIHDSIDRLRSSINDPTGGGGQCGGSWSPCSSISAAMANQELCIEGLDIVTKNTSVRNNVIEAVEPLEQMMSHLITMIKPTRQIQKNNPTATREDDINVTVALDGSGNFSRIMDAVNASPNNSQHRYVIRLKKGVYEEYVNIPKQKWNLAMIGEGQNVTIITGNRSYSRGYKTFHTATVVVNGCGFMASDLTIQNTAGPEGRQAVAMQSNADNLVFYNCTFSGYQDTLYARYGRQFYRECQIKGTVDFIFGDATAVFQLCRIMARKPMTGQSNTITAQGRKVACSDSGFSFHMCSFMAAEELMEDSIRTYLGRPWKNYSRTVIMKSSMENLIQRDGWMDWDGRLALNTIYYGEYMNSGPSSNVTDRFKWPGFHAIVNESEAMNFTVGRFIEGDQWLPSTGVVYTSGLEV